MMKNKKSTVIQIFVALLVFVSIIFWQVFIVWFTSHTHGDPEPVKPVSKDNENVAIVVSQAGNKTKYLPATTKILDSKIITDPPSVPTTDKNSITDPSRGVIWSVSGINTIERWESKLNRREQITITNFSSEKVNLPTEALPINDGNGLLIYSYPYITVVQTNHRVLQIHTKLRRVNPRLFMLKDGSILALGGNPINQTDEDPSQMVELIQYQDFSIVVSQLPNIPGPPRHGYSIVELPVYRIALVGGKINSGKSTEKLSNEILMLNIQKENNFAVKWQNGPTLPQARADAVAIKSAINEISLLGGWVASDAENETTTDRIVKWDIENNRFTEKERLPISIADPQIIVTPENNFVLLGGVLDKAKENRKIYEYSKSGDGWMYVGNIGPDVNVTDKMLYSFFNSNDRNYLWINNINNQGWKLHELVRPDNSMGTVQYIDKKLGTELNRKNFAYKPPDEKSPGLIVGGDYDGVQSTEVEAVWLDGKTRKIASLNVPRTNASVYKLADGSFIVAGGKNNQRPDGVPLEILASNPAISQSRWQTVEFEPKNILAFGQLNDGNLLGVYNDESLAKLTISKNANNRFSVVHEKLSKLQIMQYLSDANQNYLLDKIYVRQVENGDIFVMAGDYLEKISPSGTHTLIILPPTTQNKRDAHIFNDGRVMIWGCVNDNKSPKNGRIDILTSDEQGKAWLQRPVIEPLLPVCGTKLSVQSNELYMFDRQSDEFMIKWYDSKSQKWVRIWNVQSYDGSKLNNRLIECKLPNNQRQVFALDLTDSP